MGSGLIDGPEVLNELTLSPCIPMREDFKPHSAFDAMVTAATKEAGWDR